MNNYILNNSYFILGLESSTKQKKIFSRTKELINRLRVGDVPKYNIDPAVPTNNRTDISVRNAQKLLSNPKRRIVEHFFWFQSTDEVDEKCLNMIYNGNYSYAINTWRKLYKEKGSRSYLYGKNLSILLTLLLSIDYNDEYCNETLTLWNEIQSSDKFWNLYSHIFSLHDELGISNSLVNDLRHNIKDYICDIYASISEQQGEPLIFERFYKIFKHISDSTESILFSPIYNNIEKQINSIQQISNTEITEDTPLEDADTKTYGPLNEAEAIINLLNDYGIYNDSRVILLRDKLGEAIRDLSITYHNKLNKPEHALKLLDIALQVAGNSGVKARFQSDVRDIKQIKSNTDIFEPVQKLFEAERYDEALSEIDRLQVTHAETAEIVEYCESQKKYCITAIAQRKYSKAMELFNNNQQMSAKYIFIEMRDMIYNNISLFHINKEFIDDITESIRTRLTVARRDVLASIDVDRNAIVEKAQEEFGEHLEGSIIIIYVDSCIYSNLADLISKQKQKGHVLSFLHIAGWLTVWFYGFGLLFFIAAWIYKGIHFPDDNT